MLCGSVVKPQVAPAWSQLIQRYRKRKYEYFKFYLGIVSI